LTMAPEQPPRRGDPLAVAAERLRQPDSNFSDKVLPSTIGSVSEQVLDPALYANAGTAPHLNPSTSVSANSSYSESRPFSSTRSRSAPVVDTTSVEESVSGTDAPQPVDEGKDGASLDEVDDTEEWKRNRNRAAARRYRLRTKSLASTLETQLVQVQRTNEDLTRQSEDLKGALYQLKNVAFLHAGGDCDPTGVLEASVQHKLD
jgi:hypothetical protein